MIELPEAHTIACQCTETLAGKAVAEGIRGNSPHKFAFYTGTPEEYAAILTGKRLAGAQEHGSSVAISLEPGYALVLGSGGERILYHLDGATVPTKHHLLLRFTDGTYLSVSIQGWGAAQLVPAAGVHTRSLAGPARISPLSDAFTWEHFQGLLVEVPSGDRRSIKYWAISSPGIPGLGNGYLQDVLFRARLNPRRLALSLTEVERRALFEAVVVVLREATVLGGRDSERDLYNRPGRYTRILDSDMVGQPCPACGAPIVKMQYLGGSSYYCPSCQPLPSGAGTGSWPPSNTSS